ncbi:MAG: hypothetical protein SFZ03_02195 [Candidatus Melainabacteria bacterium]|nr:hypothetical protein [Candidatus Melainabacteria bacterium]
MSPGELTVRNLRTLTRNELENPANRTTIVEEGTVRSSTASSDVVVTDNSALRTTHTDDVLISQQGVAQFAAVEDGATVDNPDGTVSNVSIFGNTATAITETEGVQVETGTIQGGTVDDNGNVSAFSDSAAQLDEQVNVSGATTTNTLVNNTTVNPDTGIVTSNSLLNSDNATASSTAINTEWVRDTEAGTVSADGNAFVYAANSQDGQIVTTNDNFAINSTEIETRGALDSNTGEALVISQGTSDSLAGDTTSVSGIVNNEFVAGGSDGQGNSFVSEGTSTDINASTTSVLTGSSSTNTGALLADGNGNLHLESNTDTVSNTVAATEFVSGNITNATLDSQNANGDVLISDNSSNTLIEGNSVSATQLNTNVQDVGDVNADGSGVRTTLISESGVGANQSELNVTTANTSQGTLFEANGNVTDFTTGLVTDSTAVSNTGTTLDSATLIETTVDADGNETTNSANLTRSTTSTVAQGQADVAAGSSSVTTLGDGSGTVENNSTLIGTSNTVNTLDQENIVLSSNGSLVASETNQVGTFANTSSSLATSDNTVRDADGNVVNATTSAAILDTAAIGVTESTILTDENGSNLSVNSGAILASQQQTVDTFVDNEAGSAGVLATETATLSTRDASLNVVTDADGNITDTNGQVNTSDAVVSTSEGVVVNQDSTVTTSGLFQGAQNSSLTFNNNGSLFAFNGGTYSAANETVNNNDGSSQVTDTFGLTTNDGEVEMDAQGNVVNSRVNLFAADGRRVTLTGTDGTSSTNTRIRADQNGDGILNDDGSEDVTDSNQISSWSSLFSAPRSGGLGSLSSSLFSRA